MGKRSIPEPLDHQVLIKVAAAGINRPDIMQRQGLYPPPLGASDIPGLEISGTVVALGKAVDQLKLNDAVCALVTGGGYAEYCLASANLCLPLPLGFSWQQAAALPETFFTVWSNVFDRACLQPLAKAFRSNVITTAGSEEKCQFCKSLGADFVINYHNQDFVSVIKNLTNGHGVDVILDMVGGDYFPRHINCLAVDGRLLHIGLQKGLKAEINLLPVMLKRLTITGSTLRARNDVFKVEIANKLKGVVWPLLSSGTIKPVIHSTFSLSQARQAHALMESGQHIGKIVLEIQ